MGGTTNYTWPKHVEVVSTISASPLNGNSHRIYEFKIEHIHFGIQPEMWIRVAAYDASRATVEAWPDGSSVNVPDDWGLVNVFTNPIPENMNLFICSHIIIVLLTSKQRPTLDMLIVISELGIIINMKHSLKGSRNHQLRSGEKMRPGKDNFWM